VRVLSRHAKEDAAQWATGVEPRVGNVAKPETLRGAADGCDVVLHLVAVVDEDPPHATFEQINVEGTRNVVAEAARAGHVRVVYVSSLGADRGDSGYHRSKMQGEEIVRAYGGRWTILRPGNVYGPGDEQISLLLRMVRTLPAIPVIGGGDQPIQPAWHEDIAAALVRAVERDDLDGRVLELAGADLTSQNDLIERLGRITGREVRRIPLPEMLASAGMKALGLVGIEVPFNEEQITMLREGNRIEPGRENALATTLGIVPTPLDEGLERLADAQAEQLPEEGVGAMKRKRFWADVANGRMTPDELFEHLRHHFDDVTPNFLRVGAEPDTPRRIDEGETLTLALPLRGHVQVRVAEAADRKITMLTLEGHPLAGAVRFLVEQRGDCVRFEVQVYDRAASTVDLVAMRTVGDFLQIRSWESLVELMAEASGGSIVIGVE
jgi:NADH dehydrogenase